MKSRMCFFDEKIWFYGLLAILVVIAAVMPSDTYAFQRKVLAEYFTNTGCPLTGRWIPPVESLIEENFSGDYIQISYHTWWPENYDPWYIENYNRHLPGVDDIKPRVAYYGYDQFMGVPSFFYDGYRIRYGNPENEFHDEIREYLTERVETETPVRIEIETEIEDSTLSTTVSVYSEETLANLTLFVTLNEEYVYLRAPSGQSRFYGNLIDFISEQMGNGFRIPEGQEMTFNFESSLNLGWRENPMHNLKVIAWVANQDLEVLQAEDQILGVEEPSILIVDASDNADAGAELFSMFGTGVLPLAQRWIRGEDGAVRLDDISGYQAVIWHSYNAAEDVISEDEAMTLVRYLDGGGTLIMSSPSLGENMGQSLLFQGYLSVRQGDDDTELLRVEGDENDPTFNGSTIFLGGGENGGVPDICPSLTPAGDAEAVMYYLDEEEQRGIAAVKHVSGRYKTLTLAFPIESISGAGDTEDKDDFIARICDWIFDYQSVDGESHVETATEFRMAAAYPNPFNSQLLIPFVMSRPGLVQMNLYDLKGRKISELLNQSMAAGSHQASLDAVRAGLVNGVYIVQGRANQKQISQKVLYLK